MRLIVGDWVHGAPEITDIGVREVLEAFTGGPPSGVRVEVTGGVGWRELDSWPPPSTALTLDATAANRLAPSRDSATASTLSYRYDPADPTPAAGGRTLNPFRAGRRDQRARERRDDVLVFTGDVLRTDLVVMGAPGFEMSFTSTNPRADVFVRLCEVDARGTSRTITDGYRRLSPEASADEARSVRLDLAPIAHRFAAGSRLRLQVSSGAHPVHLRNPGTDDPVRDHSRLIPSTQTVQVGGSTPARLTLPVVDSTGHPEFTRA